MANVLKVYIFKDHKALNLVQQPMGKKDIHGNKIPRIAHQFSPNWEGKAEFKTSDPKIQAFIESTQKFKLEQIVLVKGAAPKAEEEANSGDQSEVPANPARRGKKAK